MSSETQGAAANHSSPAGDNNESRLLESFPGFVGLFRTNSFGEKDTEGTGVAKHTKI